jgi:hypothetical protein
MQILLLLMTHLWSGYASGWATRRAYVGPSCCTEWPTYALHVGCIPIQSLYRSVSESNQSGLCWASTVLSLSLVSNAWREIRCSGQAVFVICMIWDCCLVTVDPLLHLSCSAFVGVNNPVASPLSLFRATGPLCSRLADLLPKTVVCCNCGRWCTCCGKVFFFQIRSIKLWMNCCVQSRLNLWWKGS